MKISAQSIIEQVRHLVEIDTRQDGETPADILRLTAVMLLRQASDLLDAAEEAGRGN